MKLQDLITEETLGEYTRRLTRSLGIRALGTGAYGKVFQHPVYHNVAVKIFLDDPVYEMYIKWCKAHQSNPWVPKIISMQKVKLHTYKWQQELNHRPDKTATIVFFQKLRKASKTQQSKAVQQMLATCGEDLPMWEEETNLDASEQRQFLDWDKEEWAAIAKYTKDKHVREIARLFAKHDAHDIHEENVMMRDDQLVFTDPFAL
jgi:hypothetical protein